MSYIYCRKPKCELGRINIPYGSYWSSLVHMGDFPYYESFKIFFIKFRTTGNLKKILETRASYLEESFEAPGIVEIKLEHVYLIVSAFIVLVGVSVFMLLLEKFYYHYKQ